MRGLILFAHGARDPRWAEPFEAVRARMRARRPALAVGLAYLEFMQPTLQDAAAVLVAQGCTRIEVLPLFLGTGGHLRQDLPPLVEQLRKAWPQTAFAMHAAIGEHATVVQAIADTALGLLGDTEP